MMDFNADHFSFFGLQRSYRLDPLALDKRYREIQSEVHPDRFTQAGDSERRLSMQWATRVTVLGMSATAKMPSKMQQCPPKLKTHSSVMSP